MAPTAKSKIPVQTRKQRVIRQRVKEEAFDDAVQVAVKALFDFTHRASNAKALWSDAQTVWLGKQTFLHWCLDDAEVDVPWIVAGTRKAPRDREELRKAVQANLLDYYAKNLSSLPRRSTGNWLPLP